MRTRSLLILLPTLAAAGCGSQPGPTAGGEPTAAQKAARTELVKSHPKLNDLELAHLCPAIYPKGLFKGTAAEQKKVREKFQLDRLDAKASFTPADLAQAKAAGCGKPVPIPVSSGKPPAKSGKSPAKPPKPPERPNASQ